MSHWFKRGLKMKILVLRIPKTKILDDGTHLFGSEWEVTVGGIDNMIDVILWVRENFGDLTMMYYRHGSDKWIDITKQNLTHSVLHSNKNNIHDYLKIRFKDEEDAAALKLRWV